MTVVTIKDIKDTIAGHLYRKRRLAPEKRDWYRALNTKNAESRIRRIGIADKDIHPVRMYDETVKNNNLREIMDYIMECDSELEVINATTELIEGKLAVT